VAIRKTFKLNN